MAPRPPPGWDEEIHPSLLPELEIVLMGVMLLMDPALLHEHREAFLHCAPQGLVEKASKTQIRCRSVAISQAEVRAAVIPLKGFCPDVPQVL